MSTQEKREKKILYNLNLDKVTFEGIKIAREEGVNIQTVLRNFLNDYLIKNSFIAREERSELTQ